MNSPCWIVDYWLNESIGCTSTASIRIWRCQDTIYVNRRHSQASIWLHISNGKYERDANKILIARYVSTTRPGSFWSSSWDILWMAKIPLSVKPKKLVNPQKENQISTTTEKSPKNEISEKKATVPENRWYARQTSSLEALWLQYAWNEETGFHAYAPLSPSDLDKSFLSEVSFEILESATLRFGVAFAFDTFIAVERLVLGVAGDFGMFVVVFPDPTSLAFSLMRWIRCLRALTVQPFSVS